VGVRIKAWVCPACGDTDGPPDSTFSCTEGGHDRADAVLVEFVEASVARDLADALGEITRHRETCKYAASIGCAVAMENIAFRALKRYRSESDA
jgi:hypothetical protein